MESYDVIIIGGGPSGMMAAGTASKKNPNAKILLLEKNKKLGEKLSITGGSRCNITNAIFDIQEFLQKYGKAKKYLYSAFDQFSIKNTFSFFEEKKLELITESYNRVFPKSQRATDVTKVMAEYCSSKNIIIKTNTTVSKIEITNENTVSSIRYIETTKGERYSALSYILATGGLSAPETGSTGDGFNWLKKMGHLIKSPTPTLVPWKTSDMWIHNNSGTIIDNCKITIMVESKKYFSCIGKVLCTHTGISGPLILNNSHKLQDALHNGTIQGYIDFYPEKNHKELNNFILNIFDKNKNKKIKNILSKITKLPLSEFLIQKHIANFNFHIEINSISKEFRKSLVHLLKQTPITITGLEGYDKSIVADGGISLTEIDTRTMKSKKISNLHITGDLLDIRRPSGGFSLQLCWTTGYVAGIHCIEQK